LSLHAVLALVAAAGAVDAPEPGPRPEDLPTVDAVVVVRDFGEFRVRLHGDETPNHVAQFLTLAASGYYDGQSFHRVIPGYLIQAGDPASRDEDPGNDGEGGPAVRVPEESSARTHLRGTVSMAWRGDVPGTAASQWFVALSDLPALDGRATPIGDVIAGLDVVDRVAQVPTRRNRNPTRRVVIDTVRLERATPIDAEGAE
jgi:cyclophilin family peptidyl-prolyl cis-trans isomerase